MMRKPSSERQMISQGHREYRFPVFKLHLALFSNPWLAIGPDLSALTPSTLPTLTSTARPGSTCPAICRHPNRFRHI
jgi:hypothetical protein